MSCQYTPVCGLEKVKTQSGIIMTGAGDAADYRVTVGVSSLKFPEGKGARTPRPQSFTFHCVCAGPWRHTCKLEADIRVTLSHCRGLFFSARVAGQEPQGPSVSLLQQLDSRAARCAWLFMWALLIWTQVLTFAHWAFIYWATSWICPKEKESHISVMCKHTPHIWTNLSFPWSMPFYFYFWDKWWPCEALFAEQFIQRDRVPTDGHSPWPDL